MGMGDLQIEVLNGQGAKTPFILRDTLYAPEIGLTVVSINWINKASYKVEFENEECRVRKQNGEIVGYIPVNVNGIYKVEHSYSAMTEVEPVDIHTLHQ
jgi:hypothetical protein